VAAAEDVFTNQWEYLLTLLPGDLERSAWVHGVLLRRRQVRSAQALLRLALAYSLCDWPLRTVAAMSERLGLGSLSDVAVLKRLRRCGPWLGWLVGQWCRAHGLAVPAASGRLRLVDATTVSGPGSSGADWRLHTSYDAERGMFDELLLTDGRGGDSLSRIQLQPKDVVVADRGYAHPEALGAVEAAGAWLVVRFPWNNLPLHSPEGRDWDLLSFLGSLPAVAVGEAAVHVTLHGRCLPARMVGVRKTAAAAAAARRRLERDARRKGKVLDARTLECAGYVFVLTTLPPAVAAHQVLEIYRLRWQVEMAFKRLKSVLRFDQLRAKDPELARTYLYGKLLGALLVDELTVRSRRFFPWGFPLPH
jgi:hypothetical protein